MSRRPEDADEIEYLDQDIDYIGFIQSQLRGLQGISTLVYELLQNADDVLNEDGAPAAFRITFDVCDDALIVENDGVFREVDFERMRHIASGGKRNEVGTTGAFGIGFISVYQITDYPEIISSGKHWRIRPDMSSDKRIEQRRKPTQYTIFRLPWAFDVSPVREQLKIQTVNPDQLDDYTLEIDTALQLAALFLKQIKCLELKRNGKLIRRIERQLMKDRLLLIDGGLTTEWRILEGRFDAEADALRRKYSFLIESKKESNLRLAIPNIPLEAGTLFAILPTEDRIPLPFHLNADFFPSPDRKRILFDQDYQSEWNRAAVRAATQIIAEQFDRICDLFQPTELWKFIAKIQECSRDIGIDPVFQEFWSCLKPILPNKQIVYTTTKRMVFPATARLLDKDEELEATQIFECLGLQIVHPDLRPYYSIFIELGTPRLKIQDIIVGLKQKGLVKHYSLEKLPPPINKVDAWLTLWDAINTIWELRTSQADKTALKTELSQCAIAFDVNGDLWRPIDLYRGDAAARRIFYRIRWFDDLGSEESSIPRELVPRFTSTVAANHLAQISSSLENDWKQGRLDLANLYNWLEKHRSEIGSNGVLVEQLRSLELWPVKGKLKSLDGLYLAGGFDDPLNLAELIDLQALGGRSDFLHHDLRVKSLDFPTYVWDWVPKIVSEPEQFSSKARRALIQLLAIRLGEIRDNADILAMLKKLPLVECMDGEFVPANQVYFASEIITILGRQTKLASIPGEGSASVQALYEWLGVSHEPRHVDVLNRIKQLVSQPPTPESRAAIEKIFRYLANHWSTWSDDDKLIYFELKRLRWLPGTRNPTQWHSPDTLYSIFRDYLFKSQGNFLDITRQIQSEASDLIKYLGVNQEPLPIYVVRHLLACCERNEVVNLEVYTFLNDNAEDLALEDVQGKACILVRDGSKAYYVRPDQVYWNEHPFGTFRYKLGPEFLKYSALLQRLKVKERPDDDDYIQVLLDISEQYVRSNTILDEDAYTVVMNCWKALSLACEAKRMTKEILLSKLGKRKVIPDPRRLLALPENIFFEDRAGLAIKFQELLKNNVIQRSEGAWFAMDLAGVRPLSRAVSVDLTTCVDPVDDDFLSQRVHERRLLIQRVVDAEKISSGETLDGAVLERIDFRKVNDLEITFTVRAFNHNYATKPETANAVFKEDTLYTVHRNGSINWAAVSRELASAIKPVGEIGSLAGNIKDVLSSQTIEEASASLDELGFAPLQSGDFGQVRPAQTEVHSLDNELGTGVSSIVQILGGAGISREPMPYQPAETPASSFPTGAEPGSVSRQKRRKSSRLVSYVYPEDVQSTSSPQPGSRKRLTEVEKAGIQKVIEHEALYHRKAIDMNEVQPNYPGYDLESTDEQGNVRYIEVKALSGIWDAQSPGQLTKNEFEKARELGDQYWLYIVEQAKTEEVQIYPIQNPANRAGYYLFDHKWEPLASKE